MLHEHGDILTCLRNISVAELAKYRFSDNPSFLTAMGPSRDGIIIAADYGADHGRMPPRRGGSGSSRSFFLKPRSSRKLRSQHPRTYQVIGY